MNLNSIGAQYMGLIIMFIELFLKVMAIYTLFIVIKALKVYIKKSCFKGALND